MVSCFEMMRPDVMERSDIIAHAWLPDTWCGEGLVSLLACSGTIAYSCAVGSMGMMGNEQELSPPGERAPASIPSSLPGSCLPRRPGRWLARQPPVGRWAMKETDGLASRLPLVPPLALRSWGSPAFLLFLLFLGGGGGRLLEL